MAQPALGRAPSLGQTRALRPSTSETTNRTMKIRNRKGRIHAAFSARVTMSATFGPSGSATRHSLVSLILSYTN